MKKYIIVAILIANSLRAQTPDPNNCMSQLPYTKTTDPNDAATYGFLPNNFNYNNNPNAIGGPTHFDWTTTSTYPIFTTSGLTVSDQTIKSPFYCLGNTPLGGGCMDNNVRIYNDISADFTNYNTNLERLKAMDVLPEDGWELLKYSFGRSINSQIPGDIGVGQLSPYVWLYNRFTGKSKFFIAITSYQGSFINVSTATIKFTVNGDYDIMANATPFTHILSEFDHTTGTNAAMNCDIQQIGSGAPYTYYWLYAEFTTSYDPCVCRQIKPNAQLNFQVTRTSVSQLDLKLDGMATAIPVYNSGGNLNADGKSVNSTSIDNSVTTIINGVKAVIKGYKDWKEYATTIKGYFNQITNNGTTPPTGDPQAMNIITSYAQSVGQGAASAATQTQLFYDMANGLNTSGQNPNPDPVNGPSSFIQKLSGLSPLVEDLASAAPYVGAFLALTNFLTDAGSNQSAAQPITQPAAPPTSYLLNAKIYGTLTNTSNVVNGGIYLPGVKTNNDFSQVKNEDYPYPIYNNPLGIFNVIDVPNFEYKTLSMSNNGLDPNDPNMSYANLEKVSFAALSQDPTQPATNTGNPFDSFYDYRLSGQVKYSLNPTSNLSVKSIDACYIIEYNGDDNLFLAQNSSANWSALANNNNGGFSGYYSGNSIQNKQVPYYPILSSSSTFEYLEYVPFGNSTNANAMNFGISDILKKLEGVGFEIEYKSPLITSPVGDPNKIDEKLRIRTKYVPLQNLPNINFILAGAQSKKPKIYLKLFCKFSKNNKPNDEPVTFVMTYDISSKLNAAVSTGAGGWGNYNYYYMKDKSSPYADVKPGDYAHLGNVSAHSAYYTPNYGDPGPISVPLPIGGLLSTSNINVVNNVVLLPNGSSSYLTYGAVSDFNFGDNVKIATSTGPQQIVNVRAGNNINIGKGFFTNPFGGNNSVTYYAGNDINVSDSYAIGTANPNILTMYAGNSIKLNHTSSYSNIYSGNNIASIVNSNLFAKNDIIVSVSPGVSDVYIQESVLSSKQAIPNAWAVLHNDDSNIPIANLVASNSDIVNVCNLAAINNRVPSGTIPSDTKNGELNNALEQNRFKTLQSDYKIGVYPNPTNGNLTISYYNETKNDLNLTLEDITGKILMQQSLNTNQGNGHSQLDIGEYNNGIYILKISDSNGRLVKTEKIILSR